MLLDEVDITVHLLLRGALVDPLAVDLALVAGLHQQPLIRRFGRLPFGRGGGLRSHRQLDLDGLLGAGSRLGIGLGRGVRRRVDHHIHTPVGGGRLHKLHQLGGEEIGVAVGIVVRIVVGEGFGVAGRAGRTLAGGDAGQPQLRGERQGGEGRRLGRGGGGRFGRPLGGGGGDGGELGVLHLQRPLDALAFEKGPRGLDGGLGGGLVEGRQHVAQRLPRRLQGRRPRLDVEGVGNGGEDGGGEGVVEGVAHRRLHHLVEGGVRSAAFIGLSGGDLRRGRVGGVGGRGRLRFGSGLGSRLGGRGELLGAGRRLDGGGFDGRKLNG